MKILVISQYFYPENFRINELCFELCKCGHEVEVVTGLPNYPDGIFYEGYEGKQDTVEIIEGVKVHRVKIIERGKKSLSLIMNYASYAYYASRKVKKLKNDFDCVFVFEVSPITQIFPAISYAKKNKTPVFVNCQDIWPEVIMTYGFKKGGIFYRAGKYLSKKLYNAADLIITSSIGFNDYLATTCDVKREKMEYIPNFGENIFLDFGNTSANDGKYHFLFAGNIGKAQNLDCLVKAVAELDSSYRDEIHIDIVGSGSFLSNLKSNVESSGLDDYFTFHGRKQMSEMKFYYEIADCFLILLEGDSPVSLTVPAKLQGYMGAGKPILGCINGGAKQIIEDSSCGKCVPADDYLGLRDLFIDFIENHDKYINFGENGRKYFLSNFSLSTYLEKLVTLMEEKKNEFI